MRPFARACVSARIGWDRRLGGPFPRGSLFRACLCACARLHGFFASFCRADWWRLFVCVLRLVWDDHCSPETRVLSRVGLDFRRRRFL